MNEELAVYEALGKEIIRRCMADEDPAFINQWISEQVARLGGGDDGAVMYWDDSFDFTDTMLMEYETIASDPEERKKMLRFPWQSWRNYVNFIDPGTLITITAPDGQGKTIYAEMLAEYWASIDKRVAFVHFELNRKLMMTRRLSRHAGLTAAFIKDGKYNQTDVKKIAAARAKLKKYEGQISYVHTPGWTAEKAIAELRRLHSDGLCDVVIWDYLEKTAASRRQLQMFGANLYMREADNVEQMKNFAEATGIPVIQIAQMRKDAKGQSIGVVDRTGIRGAAEKTDKANLVIIIKRERTETGYSNEVDILIDKNTMGGTGQIKQIMQPEYFRVGDIA